jgi:hypothetical protein
MIIIPNVLLKSALPIFDFGACNPARAHIGRACVMQIGNSAAFPGHGVIEVGPSSC